MSLTIIKQNNVTLQTRLKDRLFWELLLREKYK